MFSDEDNYCDVSACQVVYCAPFLLEFCSCYIIYAKLRVYSRLRWFFNVDSERESDRKLFAIIPVINDISRLHLKCASFANEEDLVVFSTRFVSVCRKQMRHHNLWPTP